MLVVTRSEQLVVQRTGAVVVDRFGVELFELNASSIELAPLETGAPSLTQIFAPISISLEPIQPSAAALVQKQIVDAASIVAGSPDCDATSLMQTHAVIAQNVATDAPECLPAKLEQKHSLSASFAAGRPVCSAAVLVQEHDLQSQSILASAFESLSPTLLQKHVFAAESWATGTPATLPQTLQLRQLHVLGADGASLESPTLATTHLTQLHVLAANAITCDAPTLDTPRLIADIGAYRPSVQRIGVVLASRRAAIVLV